MAELGRATGAKAEDAEFFAADITLSGEARGEKITCYTIMTNDSIEYTLDSGSNWLPVKGAAFTAATPTEFVIYVNGTDTLNFRCPDVGGCTLTMFQVIN
jgi:hypothetical protein